jgi:hypothetical protein
MLHEQISILLPRVSVTRERNIKFPIISHENSPLIYTLLIYAGFSKASTPKSGI